MYRFKNEDLVDIWLQGSGEDEKFSAIWDYVKNTIRENIDLSNEQRLQEELRHLCRNVDERWTQTSRCKDYLEKKCYLAKRTFRFWNRRADAIIFF